MDDPDYDYEYDPYEAQRWSDEEWAAWYEEHENEPRPAEGPPVETIDPGPYL